MFASFANISVRKTQTNTRNAENEAESVNLLVCPLSDHVILLKDGGQKAIFPSYPKFEILEDRLSDSTF